MTFILGTFIGVALKTQDRRRADNLPSATYSGLAEAYLNQRQTISDQLTINSLEKQNAQLTSALAERSPKLQALNDELNQARAIAGLTAVYGPGVVVTLQDSPRYKAMQENKGPALAPSPSSAILLNFIIHDVDIQRVLTELKAGGAESFAVNGQRVIATTAIRCVGPAIQVNGIPLTPPYKIYAIGDPPTLDESLELTGGVADQIRSADPAMISITKVNKITLPPYSGADNIKYGHPVFDTPSSQN
jgi:uncharacterized protein YlxW (UPF0749 family)